jgi:hypothetical protein
MGKDDAPTAIQEEVSTQLKQVLALVGFLHPVTPKQAADVTPQDARPKECEPTGPLEPEGRVGSPIGITDDRDPQAPAREIE